jgi:hypothetical protein
MAMIAAGFPLTRMNTSDPRFLEAVAVCTPQELGDLVREAPGKGLAWYCATALGRRRDAAEQGRAAPPGAPVPAPVDPVAKWRAEREHELENRRIAIRHLRDVLGSITPEVADQRIAEAERQHRELIERGPQERAA